LQLYLRDLAIKFSRSLQKFPTALFAAFWLEPLKRNVQAEQNKGVVRRLSGKGTKKISNMIDDVKNIKFGESQQK
jgi:hypothetical protein